MLWTHPCVSYTRQIIADKIAILLFCRSVLQRYHWVFIKQKKKIHSWDKNTVYGYSELYKRKLHWMKMKKKNRTNKQGRHVILMHTSSKCPLYWGNHVNIIQLNYMINTRPFMYTLPLSGKLFIISTKKNRCTNITL